MPSHDLLQVSPYWYYDQILVEHRIRYQSKYTNDILKLNTAMDEIHSLQPKGGEMTYINQEPRILKGPNTIDAYPTTYTEPYASYSIRLSYIPMSGYWGKNWQR